MKQQPANQKNNNYTRMKKLPYGVVESLTRSSGGGGGDPPSAVATVNAVGAAGSFSNPAADGRSGIPMPTCGRHRAGVATASVEAPTVTEIPDVIVGKEEANII